ncbi:MAG: GNAT family N-acetyltransferase [Caulobacteraceae bacterium]
MAAVAALVNSAYRGDTARQGWTHEADYLDGQRTDEAALRADLAAKPDARLLLLRPDDVLLGCVWLEPAGDDVWYLGMLTVRPDTQARQLGRTLLGGAEDVARRAGARRIRMTVVSRRDTLIAWYQRRGYALTGELLPFVHGELHREDLSFAVLEKAV